VEGAEEFEGRPAAYGLMALSGEVLEVNARAVEEPEIVNEDPYGDGWLIRIRMSDATEVYALLDAGAYRAHVAEQ
jgi:glycine cleavage system H protein